VQRSGSFFEPIRDMYDVDLGITANISNIATARLLLNAGNYVDGYLNGAVSHADPIIGTFNGFSGRVFQSVTPWFAYLDFPIKLGASHEGKKDGEGSMGGLDVTVGKFGQQFTPYTLRMIDTDSYFTNDKTDLGDYPVTGARLGFRKKNLGMSFYAAVHHDPSVVPTSTGGLIVPGALAPLSPLPALNGGTGDVPEPNPLSTFVGLEVPVTADLLMDQSFGGRAEYSTRRFSVGGTYLQGSTNSHFSTPADAANLFRTLQVVGGDTRIPLFRGASVQGEWAQSQWDRRIGESLNDGFDRQALDVRLNLPLGSVLIQPFWKDIGAGFDAPGYWGRMGRWWNYRGVEGPGGTLSMPLGKRLMIDAEGASYELARGLFGTTQTGAFLPLNHGDVIYARGGLGIKLTEKDRLSSSYERVHYQYESVFIPGLAPFGADEMEQYFNAGWNHTFSDAFGMRVFYQHMIVNQAGIRTLSDVDYAANFVGTQFTVRY